MNRRALIQVLIVLLLILLLAFGAIAGLFNQDRTSRRGNPKTGKTKTNKADLSTDEGLLEDEDELSKSLPEEAKPIVNAVSHSSWTNNGGYEVFGQVENIGNATGRQIKAHIIFKDVDFQTIGEKEELIDIPTLGPGDRSGFKVTYKTGSPERIRSYVVIITQPLTRQSGGRSGQASAAGNRSDGNETPDEIRLNSGK